MTDSSFAGDEDHGSGTMFVRVHTIVTSTTGDIYSSVFTED